MHENIASQTREINATQKREENKTAIISLLTFDNVIFSEM